ncbi:hypothetical protein UY3_14570 [Chelonia mydas]|uniref:Uncharacterized protein n=1 Tax=Chelonia mydas TaxID=8469 RepID=M7B867_CHEMY|nr:hypothetical protein UY3_14570 [Chelonia mydas]
MGATQKPANNGELQTPRTDLAAFCSPASSPAQNRGRMYSLTAHGYDATGPFAIGFSHWKNPYAYGDLHLPFYISEDAGIPVYRSFEPQVDLSATLSCPASLSITPVLSCSSSSQETLNQDSTARGESNLEDLPVRRSPERGRGLNWKRMFKNILLDAPKATIPQFEKEGYTGFKKTVWLGVEVKTGLGQELQPLTQSLLPAHEMQLQAVILDEKVGKEVKHMLPGLLWRPGN